MKNVEKVMGKNSISRKVSAITAAVLLSTSSTFALEMSVDHSVKDPSKIVINVKPSISDIFDLCAKEGMNKLEAAQNILDGDRGNSYDITKAGVSYTNTGYKFKEYLEIKCSNFDDAYYFWDSSIVNSHSDDVIKKVLEYSNELDTPYLEIDLFGRRKNTEPDKYDSEYVVSASSATILNLNNIVEETFSKSSIKTINALKKKGVDAILLTSDPIDFTMYYVSYNEGKVVCTLDPKSSLEDNSFRNPLEKFYYNKVFRENVKDLMFNFIEKIT